jgi:hypothetical protein
MPALPTTYLVDSSGQQWALNVSDAAIITPTQVSGQPTAVPFVYLNSISDGLSYSVSIIGNPPPPGLSWGDVHTQQVPSAVYPRQLLVTAPNGIVYAIQIVTLIPPTVLTPAQGVLQVVLPIPVPPPVITGGPVFWNLQFEVYTAIVEAMNDLLLLVGRPTQTVAAPFSLVPNSVWQTVPRGLFAITEIWGPQSQLRKCTLYDLDYNQSNWGSDWENDTDPAGPTKWCPVGLNLFIVHPAPTAPQTVLLDGIRYPVVEDFPYSGAELVPFHHEVYEHLEQYAAHILRIKEGSAEFQESLALYKNYLEGAKRLTTIEDRRDPLVFSPTFGGPTGVNSIIKR